MRLIPFLKQKIRNLGLRARITVAFALTGLLLSAISAVATLGLARQNLLETRESAAFTVFTNNARRVLNELTSGTDDEGRRVIVERLGQASATFPLLLVDDTWTAADPLVFGRNSVPASLQELASTGIPSQIRTYIDESTIDSTVIVSALPIPKTNVEAIYFEAALLTDVESTLETLATILVAVAAINTLLSAFLGSWASQRLLKPWVQVRAAAEALAEGALDTRLDPPGDADLASLTDSFNKMARSLEDRIEREARFTSAVSHELRSPLMTITASVEVLTNRAEQLDESGHIALKLLVDDTARFNQLLEDLLEINRYDIGTADLQTEPINITKLVQQVASYYNNIDLDFRISSEAKETVIWADKRRVQQVVVNLINNAIDYGNTDITVGVERKDHYLQLSVEDKGPGVIPEERQSIFERFTRGRAGSSRGKSSGTGLGLSLVAEHVSLHQGRVWVEDRLDGLPGARFVVELPISDNDNENAEGLR